MNDDRYERGWKKLKEIDGEAGEMVIEGFNDISPDLVRYTIEFPFGDIYSRPGLDLKSREIATVAALTAMGNALPQLKVHIKGRLMSAVPGRRSLRSSSRWRYTQAFRQRSTECSPQKRSLVSGMNKAIAQHPHNN